VDKQIVLDRATKDAACYPSLEERDTLYAHLNKEKQSNLSRLRHYGLAALYSYPSVQERESLFVFQQDRPFLLLMDETFEISL